MNDEAAQPAPGRADLGGVARGSTANLLGAVIVAVTTFALTVVVTRGLSKESAGVFFSATSVFVLATAVGQLGTNTGLVYFISRARSLGQSGAVQSIFRTAVRPVALTALIMAVGMFVCAEPLGRLMVPDHAGEAAVYLRVLAFFVPLAGLEHVVLSATRGLGSMRANVVVEQIVRPLLQFVLVLGAVALARPAAIAVGWGISYLPAVILGFIMWRRVRPRNSRFAQRVTAREFWSFSGPRALASIGQMAMQRFDIVLVGAMAGAAQAALYAAATRFLVVGQMGNRSVSSAVQPRLGGTLALNDIAATNRLYRVATAWLMLISWPVYLTLIVHGTYFLGIFGKGYDAGRVVLVVLSAAMLFATAAGMVDMVLNMAGRTSWNLINVVVAVGVQFGLDIILIPRMGILGAAIGWAAGIVASNALALIQVATVLRVHPFGRAGLVAALLSVACFAGISQVPARLLGASVQSTALGLALAVLAFVAGAFLLRGPLQLRAFAAMRRGRGGGKGGRRGPRVGTDAAGTPATSGSASASGDVVSPRDPA